MIVGLIASIAGVLFGCWCYRLVAARLLPYVGSTPVADILGFFLIFLAISLVGAAIASLLATVFRWIGLSWFDHLLGGVAGALRGVLVVAGFAAVLVAFLPSPAPAFLTQSRVMPYASHVASALAQAAPRELKDSFAQQWSNLKHLWNGMQQHPRPTQLA